MMNTHERERLAYAEGYTETAAVLSQIADLEDQVETLQERIDELEFDQGKLQDTYDELVGERDALEDQHAEVREQAKTYRAALMALEAEVSPAMREFIREVLA